MFFGYQYKTHIQLFPPQHYKCCFLLLLQIGFSAMIGIKTKLRNKLQLSNNLRQKLTHISVDVEEVIKPAVKPALTEKLVPQSQLRKLQHVPLPKFDGDILQFKLFWDQFELSVDRREDLVAITKLLHLWSCLSGAVSGKPRLKVVSLKECSKNGAVELTRLHDDLNRHLLELSALGNEVDANFSGYHALLLIIKRKRPLDTLEAWRSFAQDLTNEQIT
ncbi:hypothetical protein T07_6903 [Trichinella nelsoni]|uniref:Uncharacterized protein n=1 Tax=Trichinella nelsoni TaxID=6336 RepID=A0A0V0SG71_9BILA|nr:hypothetical protein T07_6903 [Trichinella nelsoni]